MRRCPECGQENPDGGKLCVQCGKGLEGVVSPPRVASHPRRWLLSVVLGTHGVTPAVVEFYSFFKRSAVEDDFPFGPSGTIYGCEQRWKGLGHNGDQHGACFAGG